MKPEISKKIIEDIKRRGYIEINNVFYPPNSPQVELLIKNGTHIPKKKNNRSQRLKTGWIDDSLNLKNKSSSFDPFISLVKLELGLEIWTEFIFSVQKNYKFDYAIPIDNTGRPVRIAIEVDGGTWSVKRSGHSTGAGIERDRQKSSLAASEGWKLIRVTPAQLCTAYCLNLITKTLQNNS